MKIALIREKMDKFNENRNEAGKLSFQVITDYSLLNPRTKEMHNILRNDYCRLLLSSEMNDLWRIEVLDHEVVFRGPLEDCFEYMKENNLAGKLLKKKVKK